MSRKIREREKLHGILLIQTAKSRTKRKCTYVVSFIIKIPFKCYQISPLSDIQSTLFTFYSQILAVLTFSVLGGLTPSLEPHLTLNKDLHIDRRPAFHPWQAR